MSGLANTLLARSRGGVAASGLAITAKGAVEPRLPAQYEASGDRLEALETETPPVAEPAYNKQPAADRPPITASVGRGFDAAQASEATSLASAQTPVSHEIRNTIREREVRQIVVERAGTERTASPRESLPGLHPTSPRRGQTAEPIHPLQVQTQRTSVREADEIASSSPRTEVRTSESASPARPIEPKTDAIDAAIKFAVDAAMEPGMKSKVDSWLESKLSSRLDGERAADAARTLSRRERSFQQESTTKPLAAADPVIEIHIGRIEIRAAGPQPAPSRRAQRQPISLEEYGRLRKGEAR